MNGKWYLVYTYVNEMEAGTFCDGVEDKEIPLNATTEGAAVTEAKERWAEIQREYTKNPPVLKTTPNPRVIYRIPL